MKNKVFIIAEAGVNHNGSVKRACDLVDAAAGANADAVKFQTFKADKVVVKDTPKANYQKQTTGMADDQLEMIRGLELSEDDFQIIADYSREKGIEFMSTPFDLESALFLRDKLGIKRIKIPSGEVTNGPYLLDLARLGLPMILSTGMSNLEEVRVALNVLAFGLQDSTAGYPSQDDLENHIHNDNIFKKLEERVTVLHCTTEYPAPIEDINLLAMTVMRDIFQLPIGYSDHTLGTTISVAAVGMGARVIEKHLTLDKQLSGPDHRASLEPQEFVNLVSQIRSLETGLGEPEKKCSSSEEINIPIARRSIVAAKDIKKGDILTHNCLTTKRPGNGLSPMKYWDLIGTAANKSYKTDELIKL